MRLALAARANWLRSAKNRNAARFVSQIFPKGDSSGFVFSNPAHDRREFVRQNRLAVLLLASFLQIRSPKAPRLASFLHFCQFTSRFASSSPIAQPFRAPLLFWAATPLARPSTLTFGPVP